MGEGFVTINQEELQASLAQDNGESVVMLNFLRFKSVVQELGKSGKQVYYEYMNAAAPFIAKVDAEVLFYGSPKHMLIGPVDEALWDAVLIIRYGSISELLKMVKSEGYPGELRAMALQDSRLLQCQ